MRSPLPQIDQDEQILSREEISGLPCTDRVRNTLGSYSGLVTDSETVSRSDEFGYIYRYDIVYPADGEKGEVDLRSKLVLWTKDCETFELATHSG